MQLQVCGTGMLPKMYIMTMTYQYREKSCHWMKDGLTPCNTFLPQSESLIAMVMQLLYCLMSVKCAFTYQDAKPTLCELALQYLQYSELDHYLLAMSVTRIFGLQSSALLTSVRQTLIAD